MGKIGNTNALAWTPKGSHVINIKITLPKGNGDLMILGDCGNDFINSAIIAAELVIKLTKVRLDLRNLKLKINQQVDGVSAGLAIFIALYSAATKKPIKRNMAFIGQLLDNGDVIGVDKISDKLKAAMDANLECIVMPIDNILDGVTDIPICLVRNVKDALIFAFD